MNLKDDFDFKKIFARENKKIDHVYINLLPQEQRDARTNKKSQRLLSSSLYASGFVLLLAAGLLAFYTKVSQQNRIEDLQNETQAALVEIRKTEELGNLLTVQNQLESLPGLHSNKAITSRIFDYFSKIVPSEINLTQADVWFSNEGATSVPNGDDFAVDPSRVTSSSPQRITLSGEAKDPFSYNIFVDILKNAEFTAQYSVEDLQNNQPSSTAAVKAFDNVITDSASKNSENSVSFQTSLTYDPLLFSYTPTGINFRVPNITTTASETDRPDLFKEEADIIEGSEVDL